MSEKKLGVIGIILLVVLSVVASSVVTQAFFLPNMTMKQKIGLRKQYERCVKDADTHRQNCVISVNRMRNRTLTE